MANVYSIDLLAFQQKAGDGIRCFGDVLFTDCSLNRLYGDRWLDIIFPESLITNDLTATEPAEIIGIVSVYNDPTTKLFLRTYLVTRGILTRGGPSGSVRLSCEMEQIQAIGARSGN